MREEFFFLCVLMINVVIEPLTGTSSGGILLGVHFQGWSHNDGGTQISCRSVG